MDRAVSIALPDASGGRSCQPERGGDAGACAGASAIGWTRTEVGINWISPSLDLLRPVPCTTP